MNTNDFMRNRKVIVFGYEEGLHKVIKTKKAIGIEICIQNEVDVLWIPLSKILCKDSIYCNIKMKTVNLIQIYSDPYFYKNFIEKMFHKKFRPTESYCYSDDISNGNIKEIESYDSIACRLLVKYVDLSGENEPLYKGWVLPDPDEDFVTRKSAECNSVVNNLKNQNITIPKHNPHFLGIIDGSYTTLLIFDDLRSGNKPLPIYPFCEENLNNISLEIKRFLECPIEIHIVCNFALLIKIDLYLNEPQDFGSYIDKINRDIDNTLEEYLMKN